MYAYIYIVVTLWHNEPCMKAVIQIYTSSVNKVFVSNAYSNTMNKQTVATSSQITQQYETSTWIVNTKIQCNITFRIVVHNAKCVAIKIACTL